MATALIKLTQGANVGGAGEALIGDLSGNVVVENDDNSGVGSWEIQVLEVPYGSAVAKGVLAQGNSGTPLGSFAPDVIGGCFRLQLSVWPQAGRVGTVDIDIRCFGVLGANGMLAPPPQIWPEPLRDLRTGAPGAKPNEMNFGGDQDTGWAGDGNDGLLRHLIRLFGAVGGSVILADGTVPWTGNQSLGGFKITNSAVPSSAGDLTPKSYVDGLVSGLVIRPSVVAASTANVAALTGLATTVDGVLLNTDGMRVLLTGQSTANQNGPWVVHSGAWTRPTDFAAGSDAAAAYFFVQQGTALADTGWVCTSNTGSAVVGTNNLTFVQFSSAGVILADGTTTSKSGNTISVATGGVAAAQLANNAVDLAGTKVTGILTVSHGGDGVAWVQGSNGANADTTYNISDGNYFEVLPTTITGGTKRYTLAYSGTPEEGELVVFDVYSQTSNLEFIDSTIGTGTPIAIVTGGTKRRVVLQYNGASWTLASRRRFA